MRPQPYVNKFIRSTVPNTISAQHLAIIISYDGPRFQTPVVSIDIHASPILSYNYNLGYESSSELLPVLENGYIHPISLFNLSGHEGFWSDINSQNSIVDKKYIFYDDKVWSRDEYYSNTGDFLMYLRTKYQWTGTIDSDCGFYSPSTRGRIKKKTENEKAAENIMELVDKNSSTIPEGDYLKICEILKKIREI